LTCRECGEAIVPLIRRFLVPEATELLLLHVGKRPREARAISPEGGPGAGTQAEATMMWTPITPSATPIGHDTEGPTQEGGPDGGVSAPRVEASLRQQIAAEYRELSEALTRDGYATSVSIRWGDPAQQILEAASSDSADLVAMATHGRSGVSRFFAGSVTEAVLRGGNTPMLLAQLE
jgi:nucleotide-binding universal stress UspA family protein